MPVSVVFYAVQTEFGQNKLTLANIKHELAKTRLHWPTSSMNWPKQTYISQQQAYIGQIRLAK